VVTSRTGTGVWKRIREQAIRRAKRDGVTRCRHCQVLLDYEVSFTPASAEVDHLIPYAAGGKDHINNVEVICRACNGSKGDSDAPKARIKPEPLKTSREW
jgi:5-methylcytosine-specific restriction endonuclease McrA